MLGSKRTSNKTVGALPVGGHFSPLIEVNPLAHNSCLYTSNWFIFSVLTPYRCTFSHFSPNIKDKFFDAIAATRLA